MLSVKKGGIKYHFLSLWYDSTWDWTQVSGAISEHSNDYANVRYNFTTIEIKKSQFSIILTNVFYNWKE